MKSFALLIPLMALVSCQQASKQSADSGKASDEAPVVALPGEHEAEPPAPERSVLLSGDSSAYIGDVHAFEETGEYYTSVYYLPHVRESGYYDYLSQRADSVIYEDDEKRRKRIPSGLAAAYFNLIGLDRVSLYENGQHVADARFVRVEVLEDLIESQFIAVFRPLDTSPFVAGVSYCIATGALPGTENPSSFFAWVSTKLTWSGHRWPFFRAPVTSS